MAQAQPRLLHSPAALGLFKAIKHLLDPNDLLNHGVLFDPAPATQNLRVPAAPQLRKNSLSPTPTTSRLQPGRHRCTGVGKCCADNDHSVMCPSFLATTRNEKDSTRGRARVLQEMVSGSFVSGSWTSPEVHEGLDLCLARKGRASDCPTGIDMATYKPEVCNDPPARRLS